MIGPAMGHLVGSDLRKPFVAYDASIKSTDPSFPGATTNAALESDRCGTIASM